MPVEPPACAWILPDPREAEAGANVIGAGADLEPGTLLAAYRGGLFPMHLDDGEIGWWSPDPRGVLPLESFRVTRSMRQAARRMAERDHADPSFTAALRHKDAAYGHALAREVGAAAPLGAASVAWFAEAMAIARDHAIDALVTDALAIEVAADTGDLQHCAELAHALDERCEQVVDELARFVASFGPLDAARGQSDAR